MIERLVSATACQMLKVTIAQSAGKTTGRLPVVRDAKIVLVILLDPLEISVTCTMDSVTAGWLFTLIDKLISSILLFRQGFGGRRCDQCEDNFWGDPKRECIPCNCSPMGVNPEHTQCDHETGKCFCLDGENLIRFQEKKAILL